jgi:MFS family permease
MLGFRLGLILFSLLVTIGQAIFAFGVSIESYPIALLGRAVFGCGGESQNVAQSAIVSVWFEGKELSMALGMNVSISRLGSVLNDILEPALYDATDSVVLGLWVGFGLCLVSLILGILLGGIDKRRDKLMGIKEKKLLPASDKVKLSDIKSFGFSLWMICINCFVVYIDVSCFNNIASNFFQTRFNYSTQESGIIISITYIVAALLCPVFGRLVDKIGRRVFLILFSASCVTLVHLMFLLTPDADRPWYPILYMVLLGLGYSIYASVMWASIPYLVDPKAIGTAFGVATAIQNLGLGVGPLFVGYIQETTSKDGGYFWVSFFFVMMGIAGLLSGISIFINDARTGGILNSSDPRLAKQNCILSTPELGKKKPDKDLPKNVQKWLSSPTSQKALRKSLIKQQHF